MGFRKSSVTTKIFTFLMVLTFVAAVKGAFEISSVLEPNVSEKKEGAVTVVIDAGHGGNDPGKVGVNGAFEKDINLAIALKVEKYLSGQGIDVVMTRTEDKGLYEESDSNKKVRDMKKRLAIIEEARPVIAVSIHQNSYPDASVSGVQVFYYKNSEQSKTAAEIMQKQLINSLKPEKERSAKDNNSYYLLKKTSVPIIIVECAFMSNPTEAQLLTQEEYQEKIAWSIYMGIMQYINNR